MVLKDEIEDILPAEDVIQQLADEAENEIEPFIEKNVE